MRERRTSAVVLIVGLLLAACSVTPNVVRPDFPVFQTIGDLTGVSEIATDTLYTLSDGQTWRRPNDQFRKGYDLLGKKTLFIAGQDRDGTFLLLVGSQEGLPDECTYAMRYGGRDWGDAIESQGFLWHKSASFDGLDETPPDGGAYPENAIFCLDADAAVTAVILQAPQESLTQPRQSATAP